LPFQLSAQVDVDALARAGILEGQLGENHADSTVSATAREDMAAVQGVAHGNADDIADAMSDKDLEEHCLDAISDLGSFSCSSLIKQRRSRYPRPSLCPSPSCMGPLTSCSSHYRSRRVPTPHELAVLQKYFGHTSFKS
jgi:hypothetical protein